MTNYHRRRTRNKEKKRYTFVDQPNYPLAVKDIPMAEYPHLSEPEGMSHSELEALVRTLEIRIDALYDRVNVLEAGRAPVTDELGDKILTFLKEFPGVKFNTGSVAANVGATAMKLSDKLKRMAEKGVIQHEKQEGLSAMYWYTYKDKEVSE